jgi:hypothetical protein
MNKSPAHTAESTVYMDESGGLPTGHMKAKTPGSSSYKSYFAIKGEDRIESVK